jgi:hypothetical protein
VRQPAHGELGRQVRADLRLAHERRRLHRRHVERRMLHAVDDERHAARHGLREPRDVRAVVAERRQGDVGPASHLLAVDPHDRRSARRPPADGRPARTLAREYERAGPSERRRRRDVVDDEQHVGGRMSCDRAPRRDVAAAEPRRRAFAVRGAGWTSARDDAHAVADALEIREVAIRDDDAALPPRRGQRRDRLLRHLHVPRPLAATGQEQGEQQRRQHDSSR